MTVPRPIVKKKDNVEFLKHWKSHADNLLAAAVTGAHIHGSGNIAQSGKLLEKAVRKLFKENMAPTHKVVPGYFYSGDMVRSGQVDLMLCRTSELYMLNQDAKSIQGFAPFTSVSLICQVKNSASQINSALKQISASIEDWRGMKRALGHQGFTIPHKEQPLTCVIIGRSTEQELKKIRRAMKKHGDDLPTYVLVLEQGVLITPHPGPLAGDRLDFPESFGTGARWLSTPAADADHAPARVLLWLYFAIVSWLIEAEGGRKDFKVFLEAISRTFPLHYQQAI